MAKLNITPPDLNECKTYEAYKRELSAWAAVTDLPATKQGNYIALSLPNKSKFGNDLKERVFEALTAEELQSDQGLEKVKDFLNKELGKNAVDDIIEKWDSFDSCKKEDSQSLEDFITDFETRYNRIKVSGTQLPGEILAYMLMKRAGLTHIEKMLILSRIDIEKKDTLFNDVKSNMKNILGKRLQDKSKADQITLEPAFLAQNEEVLAAYGYYRNRAGTYPSKQNKQQKGQYFKKPEKNPQKEKSGRNMNPTGKDGNLLLCKACGSFRHFIADCPHSFENSTKKNTAFITEELANHDSDTEPEHVAYTEPEDINRFVLFTSDSDELSRFTSEAINAAALDTCCTTSVAGENWLKIYLESLPKDFKDKVEGPYEGEKWFQFGNQGVLKSKAKYILPATLGSKNIMIEVEIISSDIPMLLSKSAMKKAGMIIYLSEDAVQVFNEKMTLNTTSAGHYVIPLIPKAEEIVNIEEGCSANEIFVTDLMNADDDAKLNALEKLHKQFGHRPKDSFIKLLKSANSWSPDMSSMIDKIINGCEGCIKRKRNPDRPAVCMPMASEFNEKLAIDLSFYKNHIILHMVDMWSRLSVSVQIQRKKPSEVVQAIMRNWIAYFGVPGSILNDNGGEFTADEIRELKSILNVHDLTTGSESPWQNGLCEKNHALVDSILERLDEDFPDTDMDTKLAWAGMAKNSLQMTYGYSPNQLVFGQNPRLPNIISDGPSAWEQETTSEMIAKHLNALHAARKAFIQSESSSRLKTALKSKIRTSSEIYEYGDIVYYKRLKDNKWFGPAKVIFQDGKIIFVRHGSTYVRISANRIVKAGQELISKLDPSSLSKLDSTEQESSGLPKLDEKQTTVTARLTALAKKTSDMQILDDSTINVEDLSNNDDTFVPSGATAEALSQVSAQPASVPSDTAAESLPQVSAQLDLEPEGRHLSSQRALSKTKIDLRKNDKIRYQVDNQWKEGVITGRGKVTGKYKNWFNLAPLDGSDSISLDLDQIEYEKTDEQSSVSEVYAVMIPREEQNNEDCNQAKQAELEKLKEFNTYRVVEDQGQDRISCKWVLSKKGSETRARLVARGFEEEEDIPSDSPTLSKAGLRVIISLAASLNWTIQTTDIKSAFLQGSRLERKVFIKPPKEAQVNNKLWELTKALYGLKDASRQWYFRVREKLMNLGCKQSKLDPGMFYKQKPNGQLSGIIGLHVDDFLHAGDLDFDSLVIAEVNKEFEVGKSEKQNFIYTGFVFNQTDLGITMDQNIYVENLDIKPISPSRALQKAMDLSEGERTSLREMAGSLNWIVRGSRPDLAYELIDISTKFKKGKVEDLIKVSKILLNTKEKKTDVLYPNLGNLDHLSLLCFTDASLGNLNNGIDSTGGYLVFLMNKDSGYAAVLDWQANKIKRVVRSTLAAETLSLCEGLEAAIYLNNLIEELTGHTLEIHAIIDNRSVVDAVRSTTTVDDKRLRRDISAVKQTLETGEVKTITWVPGNLQLADVLTKRGSNGYKLLNTLHTGKIDHEILQILK